MPIKIRTPTMSPPEDEPARDNPEHKARLAFTINACTIMRNFHLFAHDFAAGQAEDKDLGHVKRFFYVRSLRKQVEALSDEFKSQALREVVRAACGDCAPERSAEKVFVDVNFDNLKLS